MKQLLSDKHISSYPSQIEYGSLRSSKRSAFHDKSIVLVFFERDDRDLVAIDEHIGTENEFLVIYKEYLLSLKECPASDIGLRLR